MTMMDSSKGLLHSNLKHTMCSVDYFSAKLLHYIGLMSAEAKVYSR